MDISTENEPPTLHMVVIKANIISDLKVKNHVHWKDIKALLVELDVV